MVFKQEKKKIKTPIHLYHIGELLDAMAMNNELVNKNQLAYQEAYMYMLEQYTLIARHLFEMPEVVAEAFLVVGKLDKREGITDIVRIAFAAESSIPQPQIANANQILVLSADDIDRTIAAIAADLRPPGKRNVEEWEEYGISVAKKLLVHADLKNFAELK